MCILYCTYTFTYIYNINMLTQSYFTQYMDEGYSTATDSVPYFPDPSQILAFPLACQ